MKLSVQSMAGLVVGGAVTGFGVWLLSPASGVSENQSTPALAYIVTALGVAIIGSSVLSGVSSVSGQSPKLMGLNIEATGGLSLFVVTLVFLLSFGGSGAGDKETTLQRQPAGPDGGSGANLDQALTPVFRYETFCDVCCQDYASLAQCPYTGVGEASSHFDARQIAIQQCVAKGGYYERCQANAVWVQ